MDLHILTLVSVEGHWRKYLFPTETRKKISETGKGRLHSEEWKKKMSDKMKGRVFTEEWKKKLSEAKKRRFEVLKRQSPINAA